jgi:hypothetical protein
MSYISNISARLVADLQEAAKTKPAERGEAFAALMKRAKQHQKLLAIVRERAKRYAYKGV